MEEGYKITCLNENVTIEIDTSSLQCAILIFAVWSSFLKKKNSQKIRFFEHFSNIFKPTSGTSQSQIIIIRAVFIFFLMILRPPGSTLFPYTSLFRSLACFAFLSTASSTAWLFLPFFLLLVLLFGLFCPLIYCLVYCLACSAL